mmetsp:Transcript_123712/g.174372  ORF Transcript_123712/g.174372 Transcript_123712/m.174372 type:complete len:215 (-) Transcript_123712:253-897(-)
MLRIAHPCCFESFPGLWPVFVQHRAPASSLRVSAAPFHSEALAVIRCRPQSPHTSPRPSAASCDFAEVAASTWQKRRCSPAHGPCRARANSTCLRHSTVPCREWKSTDSASRRSSSSGRASGSSRQFAPSSTSSCRLLRSCSAAGWAHWLSLRLTLPPLPKCRCRIGSDGEDPVGRSNPCCADTRGPREDPAPVFPALGRWRGPRVAQTPPRQA